MPLSDRQRRLAQAKAKGLDDKEACKEAGYKASTHGAACNQVARMMKNDEFIEYLEGLRGKIETKHVKTAQEVSEDLTEMMNKAKTTNEFNSYVAMANRLAKMHAHDEPERVKLEFEVNIGGDGDAEG